MLERAKKLAWLLVMDAMERLWLLSWIPWRIFSEMFLNYIWTPKRTLERESPRDYFQTGLGDRKMALKRSLEYWWKPHPTSPNVLLQRKQANQILFPLVVQVYIRDVLRRKLTKDSITSHTALLGARVCNIQCGAGFLTECLVDAGAEVTGIDTDENCIMTARAHWQKTKGDAERPTYLVMSAEELSKQRVDKYDIVVCSQPLNQTINWRKMVNSSRKLVSHGGCLILCSASRTLPSFAWNILALEHCFGLSAIGSHRFYQFLKAEDVTAEVEKDGSLEVLANGGFYPFGFSRRSFKWIPCGLYNGIWFNLVAKKNF